MDFKIEARKKLAIEIYGETFEMSKPTVGQIEVLNSELKKAASDEDKISIMRSFIAHLGLPEAKVKNMEVDDFTELCNFLASPKKK
jgi:hypothetical protein